MPKKKVSDLTIRRLPRYLHCLRELAKNKKKFVSATKISKIIGIHRTQIRKDFSSVGVRGRPKVGHEVNELIREIENYLNWNSVAKAILIGTGHLGSALLGYNGFELTGIQIDCAFDNNEEKIGTLIHDKRVLDIEKMPNYIRDRNIKIGILATPSQPAQKLVDKMVENGILAIWNFTKKELKVPDHVIVETVNLYSSLAVLLKRFGERYSSNLIRLEK